MDSPHKGPVTRKKFPCPDVIMWGWRLSWWKWRWYDDTGWWCVIMIAPTKTWWRHQMETFSALLAVCAGNSPAPVISPHKGQWRGALMFSLIWARINDWVNNLEAGDLRRHRGHYDVNVMNFSHRMFKLFLSDRSLVHRNYFHVANKAQNCLSKK